MALQRLKEAAEKAKQELSTTLETEVNLPFITADASGPKHLTLKLTRAKFEQMVDDLLQRTMAPVRQCLKDAGLEPSQIEEVVLVGGSTRIPKVQQLVKEFFGREPHKGVNPDEVVAIGAAVQAGVLSGDVKDLLLLDVTPLSLDIDANGIVNVSAKDRGTGKSQAITITASSGLAKDEVERMVQDAQAHEEEDKENREAIEAKNRADGLVYGAEKFLSENKDKLSEADTAPVNQALEEARKAIEGGDKAAIEAAVQNLEKAQHKLAEILYQKSASSGGEAPPSGGDPKPAGGDDVIDAEVVDK